MLLREYLDNPKFLAHVGLDRARGWYIADYHENFHVRAPRSYYF